MSNPSLAEIGAQKSGLELFSDSDSEGSSGVAAAKIVGGKLVGKVKHAAKAKPAAAAPPALDRLTVNERFKTKYEKRKNDQELAYARKVLDEEGVGLGNSSDESDSEVEDEDADLLTADVDEKINETLLKIRQKDASIYDKNVKFFSSKDFFAERRAGEAAGPAAAAGERKQGAKKGGEKAFTYKDMVRETLLTEGAAAFAEEEDRADANARFGAAASGASIDAIRQEIGAIAGGDAGGSDSDSGDNLFEKKQPSQTEQAADAARQASWKDGKRGSKFAEKFWGPDGEKQAAKPAAEQGAEDAGEAFLRDFIVNEGWKDSFEAEEKAQAGSRQRRGTGSTQATAGGAAGEVDDSEDEEHLDRVDDFERELNFRFEEDGGLEIQTHPRNVPNSVRQKTNKRAKQRKERGARKGEEQVRRAEELKRLRTLKKKEIERRLRQIGAVSGSAALEPAGEEDAKMMAAAEKAEEEAPSAGARAEKKKLKALGAVLEQDYDPAQHDAEMRELLGTDFDTAEEALDEDALMEVPDVLAEKGEAGEEGAQQEAGEAQPQEGEENEEASEENEWFTCDECRKAIFPGKLFFEAKKGGDALFCQKCYKKQKDGLANVKFAKKKVPKECRPPANWEALVAAQAAEGEDGAGEGEDAGEADPERQRLLQQFAELDEEVDEKLLKMTAGAKFLYSKTRPEDYNLTVEEILSTPDEVLNRKVPLKRVSRPYKDSSDYRDERTEKYEKMVTKVRKDKRKQKKKTGVSRDRLEAYMSHKKTVL